MKNQYCLRHEYDGGEENYHFTSSKSYDELLEIIGGWNAPMNEELEALCDKLNINYEPWKGEHLTFSIFEDPRFVDID